MTQRIAVLQMRSGIDPAANTETMTAAIATASAEGAEIVFTPEMSGLLDRDRKRASSVIATEDDDTVLAAVRAEAAAHNIWVHLGSLALRSAPGSDRFVNRGFLIDGEGQIRARYDKMHLFDVDLDTGESWRESAVYDGGDKAVVADSPVGRIGLSVCYDIRFPRLYQNLADAEATLLTVPAAFTVPTGKAHWHVLLRARAIENAAFVVAAAQHGKHEDGRETFGHSVVVDPWGEVLLDMGDGEGLGFAEIDRARLSEVRRRIPVGQHRREISAAELQS
ncbi:carbon-nitrogen hydrolase family protein [uncultured Parasphingopyxis sp.]|uniref:carbon-nitrogen hydrolase family protein n=1 Tax=uncultured Parasphingopyxis sp. TaxID=1547918 RepID=UPI002619697A|nr:carbon-nitrogen hydrolase family protein [uncultured Parasphingopyxis sp.]